MRNWKSPSESHFKVCDLLHEIRCDVLVYGEFPNACFFSRNNLAKERNITITVLLYLRMWKCVLFHSELVEAGRKALISRVVELTDDRTALTLEVISLQETVSRLEGRMKEKEEESKRCRRLMLTFWKKMHLSSINITLYLSAVFHRLRNELETCQSDDVRGQCSLLVIVNNVCN